MLSEKRHWRGNFVSLTEVQNWNFNYVEIVLFYVTARYLKDLYQICRLFLENTSLQEPCSFHCLKKRQQTTNVNTFVEKMKLLKVLGKISKLMSQVHSWAWNFFFFLIFFFGGEGSGLANKHYTELNLCAPKVHFISQVNC